MAKGRKICPDVQQIVVQLSSRLSKEEVAAYTSISITAVNKILRHFREHGAIDDKPKERRRRAQVLRDGDVNMSSPHIFFTSSDLAFFYQFLFETVQEKPDAYLDELREMLTVNCGIQVSRTSIWRTLRAGGFTMKKV